MGTEGHELVNAQRPWCAFELRHAPLAQPEALAELGLRELEAFARALQDDSQLGGYDERLCSMKHILPLIPVKVF